VAAIDGLALGGGLEVAMVLYCVTLVTVLKKLKCHFIAEVVTL
jgi:hypothetical protein